MGLYLLLNCGFLGPLFVFKSARLLSFNSPAYFTWDVKFKNPDFIRIHAKEEKE